VAEQDFLTEEDIADVTENLEDGALDLFNRLVEHGANRGKFYRELRGSDRLALERVREELRDHGDGYTPIDIRKSKVAKQRGEVSDA
jgi:hypothetical protein